jgi:RNA recognition motif-containing protein
VRLQREAQEVNLGYAFVTFSHSDEAKLALILANGMFVENKELELMIKNEKIDHKDLDTRYQMNKQRNESKITEELKALREARKDLREFEQNIDKDLPSLKKLKEFRTLAREVIDNRAGAKLGSLTERTSAEEEALNEKIRAL